MPLIAPLMPPLVSGLLVVSFFGCFLLGLQPLKVWAGVVLPRCKARIATQAVHRVGCAAWWALRTYEIIRIDGQAACRRPRQLFPEHLPRPRMQTVT